MHRIQAQLPSAGERQANSAMLIHANDSTKVTAEINSEEPYMPTSMASDGKDEPILDQRNQSFGHIENTEIEETQ